MSFLVQGMEHLLFPNQWIKNKIKEDQFKHGLLPSQNPDQKALFEHPKSLLLLSSVTNTDPPHHPSTAPFVPPSTKNIVPLGPEQVVHMEDRGRVVSGQNPENMTRCPFINLSWKLHRDPGHLFYVLWDITKKTVTWVVWNYEEFYRLMTHAPIVQHWYNLQGEVDRVVWLSEVVWRGIIVAGITWGLINITPLLVALTEWFTLFVRFLRSAFGLVGKALSDVLYVVERIYEDIRSILTSLIGTRD